MDLYSQTPDYTLTQFHDMHPPFRFLTFSVLIEIFNITFLSGINCKLFENNFFRTIMFCNTL